MKETAMKKTCVGRRRIPIQKIENKTKRNVTFSKRKDGLFKKASELSTLCGSEIAVLVFSEAGKVFTFGHPSADSVFQRYVRGSNSSNSSHTLISTTQSGISTNSIHAQFGCGAFGLDNRIDRLGLDELKLYSNYLENIRDVVASKAASMDCSSPYMSDMGHMATTSTDVSNLGNQNTSSNDLFGQENLFGGLEMHSKNLEELNNTSDLDFERAMIDSPTTVVGESQLMTSSNDFYVQEKSVDDVQLDDLDFSKYMEELIDFYDVKSPEVDSPTDVIGDSQRGDCFKWKEADSSEYMFIGEGMMDDGYEKSDVLPSSFSFVDVDAEWGNSLCDIQWEEDLDLLASFSQD